MDHRGSDHEARPKTHPGLDGLRALAVLAVILSHQLIWKQGWVGVQIFFVLSGFLITGILYRARHAPLRVYLRNFYGRRLLRIFPLYYAYLAVIALAVLLGRLPSTSERLQYAAVYLGNHYYGSGGGTRLLLHFWSLAVEEQFYLVWPFFIYFCPARLLRGFLVTLVMLGIPIRYAANFYFEQPGYLALSHLDAFGIGALSALFPWRLKSLATALLLPGLWALGLFVLTLESPLRKGSYGWGYIVGVSVINAASALLVEALVERRLPTSFFEHRALRYGGKISYGLYIFHFPVQALVERLLPNAPVLVRLVAQLGLTVAIATATFTLLESRFLALKERWFGSAPALPSRASVSTARV